MNTVEALRYLSRYGYLTGMDDIDISLGRWDYYAISGENCDYLTHLLMYSLTFVIQGIAEQSSVIQ